MNENERNMLAIKTLVDKYGKIALEKAELERRIEEIQRQLLPAKNIVPFIDELMYLN